MENDVREDWNNATVQFTETKERAIEIAKFKIQEDLAIHRKMQSLVFTTSE
jgi:hypothetical protein